MLNYPQTQNWGWKVHDITKCDGNSVISSLSLMSKSRLYDVHVINHMSSIYAPAHNILITAKCNVLVYNMRGYF